MIYPSPTTCIAPLELWRSGRLSPPCAVEETVLKHVCKQYMPGFLALSKVTILMPPNCLSHSGCSFWRPDSFSLWRLGRRLTGSWGQWTLTHPNPRPKGKPLDKLSAEAHLGGEIRRQRDRGHWLHLCRRPASQYTHIWWYYVYQWDLWTINFISWWWCRVRLRRPHPFWTSPSHSLLPCPNGASLNRE